MMSGMRMLELPRLVLGFAVGRLRRFPGARFVAPLLPWLTRGLLLAAVALLIAWGVEASPQRLPLADLAAGDLGPYQSWVIVSGNLAEEPGSDPGRLLYRLTDPAAPNAHLVVRSTFPRALGWTTLSGRVEGGRDGVPPGYTWSARLRADPTLAPELPPPWTTIIMTATALLIMAGRRSEYPLFVVRTPAPLAPSVGRIAVGVQREADRAAGTMRQATLDLSSGVGAAAELQIPGAQPIPIRLYSSLTSVDAGELRTLRTAQPALRIRAAVEDLTLTFASDQKRDAAFATLTASALTNDRGQARTSPMRA
jgi:hypothetical protein